MDSLPDPAITQTSPWLLALVAVLLLAVVGSAMIGLRAVDSLSYEFAVADRPARVDRTLESLLSAAQDIETGQRGYLLSGNEAYLEPYNQGLKEVGPMLDTLDQLVSWNPFQVERMPVLRARIDSVTADYAASVDVRREAGLAPAMARVQRGDGKTQMDSVRTLVSRMQSEARRVQALRHDHVADAERAARRALWASALVLISGLLVASGVVRRTLASRSRAIARLSASTDKVRQSNDALSQAWPSASRRCTASTRCKPRWCSRKSWPGWGG